MEPLDAANLVDEFDEMNWSPDDLDVYVDFFDYFDKASSRIDRLSRIITERRDEWRNKPTEWTSATRTKFQSRLGEIETLRDKYRNRLDQQVKKYEHMYFKNRDVRIWRDKISWVTGVGNCVTSPLVAVLYPEWVPLLFAVQSVFFMTARVIIFRRQKWHYFLWDMCYFVNFLTLVVLFAMPDSKALFTAVYGLSHGPMLWAIAVWRNSLVFHSMDRVTSVFIHLYPPFVLYTIRFLLPQEYRLSRFPAVDALSDSPPTFIYMMVTSLSLYLVWQILYYTFIMKHRRRKVEEEGRVTSYSWLLSPNVSRPSKIQQVCNTFGPSYNKEMFILLQFGYTAIVTGPAIVYFRSVSLNTIALATMFMLSVWNGGSYYIEVFSRRYVLELERLEMEERERIGQEGKRDPPVEE